MPNEDMTPTETPDGFAADIDRLKEEMRRDPALARSLAPQLNDLMARVRAARAPGGAGGPAGYCHSHCGSHCYVHGSSRLSETVRRPF